MNRLNILRKVLGKIKFKKNTLTWTRPNFYKEYEGYFGNSACSDYLKNFGHTFVDEKELSSFLSTGILTRVPDKVLSENGKNLTVSLDSLEKNLENQSYSFSFKHLEKSLMEKNLHLEAPILIQGSDGSYWGFSGNRRANLARKYGFPILFFVVKV